MLAIGPENITFSIPDYLSKYSIFKIRSVDFVVDDAASGNTTYYVVSDNVFTTSKKQIYGSLLKVKVTFENSMTMTSLEYNTSLLRKG